MKTRVIKGITIQPKRHMYDDQGGHNNSVMCGLFSSGLDVVRNMVFVIADTTCPDCLQADNRRLSDAVLAAEQHKEIVIPIPTTPSSLRDLVHIPSGTRTCCGFGLSDWQRGSNWRESYELSEVTCPACRRNLGEPAQEVSTSLIDIDNMLVSERIQVFTRVLEGLSASTIHATLDNSEEQEKAKILAWASNYTTSTRMPEVNVGTVVEGYCTSAARIIGVVIGGGSNCRVMPIHGPLSGIVSLLWPTVRQRTDAGMPTVQFLRRNTPRQSSISELRRFFANPLRFNSQGEPL